MIEHRSYIVAEILEPVRSQVQAIRDSLNTRTARLPVEITLAGSSGVGPIPAGTDLLLIERRLDRTLANIAPFAQVEYCENLIFRQRAALDELGDRLLDANRNIGRPDKLTVIFGRRINKQYNGKLQTEIASEN